MSTATKAKPTAKPTAKQTYTIQEVSLSLFSPGNSPTQIPGRTNLGAIRKYCQDMIAGLWAWDKQDSYPVVFSETAISLQVDPKLWIGDGHHTIESALQAASQIGLETIRCKVFLGGFPEALEYAYTNEKNRSHGVPISQEQRRSMAIATLRSPELMLDRIAIDFCGGDGTLPPSARAIASWLNLSHPTIETAWNTLLHGSTEPIWAEFSQGGEGEILPYLLSPKAVSRDGSVQAIDRATPKTPKAKKPTEKPVQPESGTNVLPKADSGETATPPVKAQGGLPSGGRSEEARGNPSEATPAENGIVGAKYTGAAAKKRIEEIAAVAAIHVFEQVCKETDLMIDHLGITELRRALAQDILGNIEGAIV